ncbi:MAG: N-acetylmuramoyl-L-alanine amidase [Candidatus Omnitrophota bacterium]
MSFLRKLLLPFLIVIVLTSCAGPHAMRTPDGTVISIRESPANGHILSNIRQAVYHDVAPGETLWRICQMYGVDIELITEINRISNVRDLDIGRRLYIPDAAPRKDVITLYPNKNKKWRYVVIHHSATDMGNSMNFNNAHLKRGWQGVGYHFIIDNGTCGKDDGQIETSPRWIKQMDGAHCLASGMNERGIGICLVGNFSKDKVSDAQMASLVQLVNELCKFYNIPRKRIFGHGKVPGASTECPGTQFPWKDFWTRLGR